MSSIRLFRNTETDFTHNEWVLNKIISCKPIEGINDDYTTELEYPLEDTKGISSNFIVGGVISSPTIDSRPDQLFRIIDKETTSSTIIVQCQAKLLADLKENRVRAMTLTGLTVAEAITAVLNAALESHNYTVGTKSISTNTNVIVSIKEGSLLSAIVGDENSILSEYGGEFVVDNNTIDIVNSRGSDNGVVIEYGKNLSSISEKINNIDLATVLIPKSGDYRLPEYYIESHNIGVYEKRYFKEVDLNLNIWDGENEQGEDQITLEEAYDLMRATCNKMFTVDKVDQMTFNYTVDFVQLSQTEEYKNYAILETVNLGDKVTIKHKKLNLNLEGRVNKISYSVDSEGITTIDTVSIGFNRKDITDIIKTTIKSIKFAKDEIMLSVANTAKGLQSSIDLTETQITAVVKSNDGGMTWILKEDAFIVACSGASNSNVTIDANGLNVNNGKIIVRNSNGDIVFKVSTSGKCTADKGFIVTDGDSTYKIDSDGITMTNENGYTSRIYVSPDGTTLIADDDFQINNTLNVIDTARFRAYSKFYENVDIMGDLYVSGTLIVNGDSLEDIIDARIAAASTTE